MNKVKYLFRRIFSMDFSALFEAVNEIHEKENISKIRLFFDIVWCGFKYQAGYMDYRLFEMYKMNKYQRKTLITRGINNSFIVKYNDPKYMQYLNNKVKFNESFNEYLNRDWIEMKSEADLKNFSKKHSKFIVKPLNLMCGKGIEIIDTKGKNMSELYQQLNTNGQTLLEEIAVQTKRLSDLHPTSVNTIRVVTLLGEVVVAFLRIGNNNEVVDNFNHGGMAAPIDIEDGVIKYKAIDKAHNLYEVHPLTNKKIVGLQIPKWKEVIELCEKASLEIPQVGYVGWDVCVGEKKCFLIEANEFPGHDIYSLPPHRENNIGLLPKFREVEKRGKEAE